MTDTGSHSYHMELADKLERDRDLSDDEFAAVLISDDPQFSDYLSAKARSAREKVYGKDVYLRGLIEFTNYCRNNCNYCGIRSGNKNAERYRLSVEDIISCCDMGYGLGFRTFVLQGGEDPYYTDERIVSIIGKIKETWSWQSAVYGSKEALPTTADPIPSNLDWDLWLGTAPARPYNPAYHPFVWRGWWDFGTGALGDIGCHFYAPIFRACGLTGHYPKTVHAVSTRVNEETFPLGSVVEWQFDSYDGKPPLKMVWYDGGLRPFRPDIVPEGVAMAENGRLIIGDEGMILDSTIFDEKRRKEVGDIPKTLERSPGHYQEFVIACKDPKTPARMNFDQAAPLAEVVLMGNVALRMGLREDLTRIRLHWDQEQFKFTNSKEATEYVHKSYRDGWKIEGCEL